MTQLQVLADRFGADTSGHEILSHFDMIAANSGGSLTLGGLVCNLSPAQMIKNASDEEKRRQMFSPIRPTHHFLPNGIIQFIVRIVNFFKGRNEIPFAFGPRYRTTKKGKFLMDEHGIYEGHHSDFSPRLSLRTLAMKRQNLFSGKPLPFLLIASYDAMNHRAKFFHSPRPGDSDNSNGNVLLGRAIHGSTNAPVNYFDQPANFGNERGSDYPMHRIWDGGLSGYNNPSHAAVIEAFKLGKKRSEIRVISLGTRESMLKRKSVATKWLGMFAAQRGRFTFRRFRDIKTISKKYGGPIIGIMKYLSLQRDFFIDTLKTMSTTILKEPADGASYLALQFMADRADSLPVDRFIRMSPLLSPDDATDSTQSSFNLEGEVELASQLDFDLVDPHWFLYTTRVFNWWRKGLIPNQPITHSFGKISEDQPLKFKLGDKTYSEAMKRWREWA